MVWWEVVVVVKTLKVMVLRRGPVVLANRSGRIERGSRASCRRDDGIL